MIKFSQKGDWSKTNNFLERALNVIHLGIFDKYGKEGVKALAAATPIDSGVTADSWYYKIIRNEYGVKIEWLNSNVNQGIPIAILIQYGHGLQNGSYIQGIDFINPAIKPIFNKIAEEAWKELTKK